MDKFYTIQSLREQPFIKRLHDFRDYLDQCIELLTKTMDESGGFGSENGGFYKLQRTSYLRARQKLYIYFPELQEDQPIDS
jgi:hypothetical protein